MFIVKFRKIFYAFSLVLVAISITALALWGLKPGIDLRGGSIVEVAYSGARPDMEAVQAKIEALKIGSYSVRPTGTDGFIVRTEELTQDNHDKVLVALAGNASSSMEEKRFDSVGPTLGEEALQKSWISIAMVLLAIVLFIAFAFRNVSRPVSSWKYGLMAIVGLVHDLILTAGAFAIFGHFFGFEVDTLFITALLVVLGFSIHDTIVVFDRVRENLHINGTSKAKSFETIVGESVSQTFVRSVNTSLTTLIAIAVLYFVGPEATQHFALALLVGIAVGTYSSIFLCAPLLVTLSGKKQAK